MLCSLPSCHSLAIWDLQNLHYSESVDLKLIFKGLQPNIWILKFKKIHRYDERGRQTATSRKMTDLNTLCLCLLSRLHKSRFFHSFLWSLKPKVHLKTFKTLNIWEKSQHHTFSCWLSQSTIKSLLHVCSFCKCSGNFICICRVVLLGWE